MELGCGGRRCTQPSRHLVVAHFQLARKPRDVQAAPGDVDLEAVEAAEDRVRQIVKRARVETEGAVVLAGKGERRLDARRKIEGEGPGRTPGERARRPEPTRHVHQDRALDARTVRPGRPHGVVDVDPVGHARVVREVARDGELAVAARDGTRSLAGDADLGAAKRDRRRRLRAVERSPVRPVEADGHLELLQVLVDADGVGVSLHRLELGLS